MVCHRIYSLSPSFALLNRLLGAERELRGYCFRKDHSEIVSEARVHPFCPEKPLAVEDNNHSFPVVKALVLQAITIRSLLKADHNENHILFDDLGRVSPIVVRDNLRVHEIDLLLEVRCAESGRRVRPCDHLIVIDD